MTAVVVAVVAAVTVEEVFIIYSNPPSMIKSIVLQINSFLKTTFLLPYFWRYTFLFFLRLLFRLYGQKEFLF